MATMVIRVWHERAREAAFRARLTFDDEDAAEPRSLVSGDTEQILDTVRQWLAAQGAP